MLDTNLLITGPSRKVHSLPVELYSDGGRGVKFDIGFRITVDIDKRTAFGRRGRRTYADLGQALEVVHGPRRWTAIAGSNHPKSPFVAKTQVSVQQRVTTCKIAFSQSIFDAFSVGRVKRFRIVLSMMTRPFLVFCFNEICFLKPCILFQTRFCLRKAFNVGFGGLRNGLWWDLETLSEQLFCTIVIKRILNGMHIN